ncbi:MAG: hypothetical protein ACK55X_05635 [Synechococcaceae cyanobacterium]
MPGPYRVRTVVAHEHTVPDEVRAPRFASLALARAYAGDAVAAGERGVVIEKLAPGGCWLPLLSL